MEKVIMKLGGLTCPSCLTKIEKSVASVEVPITLKFSLMLVK